jgi:hypothetical protein
VLFLRKRAWKASDFKRDLERTGKDSSLEILREFLCIWDYYHSIAYSKEAIEWFEGILAFQMSTVISSSPSNQQTRPLFILHRVINESYFPFSLDALTSP